MNASTLTCHSDHRRSTLIDKINRQTAPNTNGIDYIEIVGKPEYTATSLKGLIRDDEHLLHLRFFTPKQFPVSEKNVWIRGGRRNRVVEVVGVDWHEMPVPKGGCGQLEAGNVLQIVVRGLEKAATYRLRLLSTRDGRQTNEPLPQLDPRFAEIAFTYRKEPNTEVDFHEQKQPARPTRPDPDLNYLAKDYASFRQLMLDRLALLMPDWRERHAADIGVMLVELLAYVGDRLSYRQDAVATEAYLGTARQRISVRRHARLVDYRMHEGCNSRALVQIKLIPGAEPLSISSNDLYFITQPTGEFALPKNQVVLESQLPAGPEQRERFFSTVEVFEPIIEPPGPLGLTIDDLKDPKAIFESLQQSDDPEIKSLGGKIRVAPLLEYFEDIIPEDFNDYEKHYLVDALNLAIHEEQLSAASGESIASVEGKALVASDSQLTSLAATNRATLDRLFEYKLSSSHQTAKIHLFEAHNAIRFYTWDESECWLPAGATSATLWDRYPAEFDENSRHPKSTCNSAVRALRNLSVGDILIFEEVMGPLTGADRDADPRHRQSVRLTKVSPSCDAIKGEPIVEIQWHEEDALRFPLCLSSTTRDERCKPLTDVSLALGNIVLVDHGRTVDEPSDQPEVADDSRYTVLGDVRHVVCGDACRPARREVVSQPYQLVLQKLGLTFAAPIHERLPASRIHEQDVQAAYPHITLTGVPGTAFGKPLEPDSATLPKMLAHAATDDRFVEQFNNRSRLVRAALAELLPPELAFWLERLDYKLPNTVSPTTTETNLVRRTIELLQRGTAWLPKHDLVDRLADDRHFVVEMDNRQQAHLRFGDDRLGGRPSAGTQFYASYRVGNGRAGNVGADSIKHVVLRRRFDGIAEVRNPFPAAGGQEPEAISEVKLIAPHAYRQHQPRALIAEDYSAIVLREFRRQVQAAKAVITWVGAWYQVIVAIDPFDSVNDSNALLREIEQALYLVRSIGHEVHVKLAEYVPLDVVMTVCIDPDYLRSQVKRELMDLFSNRQLADGKPALFHADRLTFGKHIYRSHLIAAAQAVSGVEAVRLDRLQPKGVALDPSAEVLEIGPLQIARLDNVGTDEHGTFCLELRGGK